MNDCLALAEWARQHGYALVRLPAVRGSRQSVNVKLATTILDNVSAYLKYDGQVRVDGDPSQAPYCSFMPLTIPRIKLGGVFTYDTQFPLGMRLRFTKEE